MIIDITPRALSHLYKDYNPTLELKQPRVTDDFIDWVHKQYNGHIEKTPHSWSVRFDHFIDLLVFCNRYDL